MIQQSWSFVVTYWISYDSKNLSISTQFIYLLLVIISLNTSWPEVNSFPAPKEPNVIYPPNFEQRIQLIIPLVEIIDAIMETWEWENIWKPQATLVTLWFETMITNSWFLDLFVKVDILHCLKVALIIPSITMKH